MADADHASQSETLVRRIMADVRAHAGDADQSDDITVLALRFLGVDGAQNTASAMTAAPDNSAH